MNEYYQHPQGWPIVTHHYLHVTARIINGQIGIYGKRPVGRPSSRYYSVINVSKSGIIHVRQKRVARMGVQYVIDNEKIPMVEQYR